MEANKAELGLGPTINDLPNEILLKIFEFLPQSAHYAVGLISNRFRDLIDNTKWWEETPILEITENNVQRIKEAIDNKNNIICFKSVEINEVKNIEDLEYILKSIGKEIEYLSLRRTAAFHLLKENVINLKSLEINFDYNFRNNVNNGSFNLKYFPLLEGLSFMNNAEWEMRSTTIKLLEQLKSPSITSRLKHFKLVCNEEIDNFLIDTLLHYSSTLESLEVLYNHLHGVENSNNWKNAFSRMKKLKKLCLTGNYFSKMINVILTMLPKETPLEHLELVAFHDLEFNEMFPLFIEKWMDTLQYLELHRLLYLTDATVMELGKLHKLRVLKLIDCREITKMAFLEGIAKDQNIFLDELHLTGIWYLDESSMDVIISRFPNLRILTMNNMKQAITNFSLARIFRFSTRLRSLYINDCRNITDEGFIGLENEPYSINRLRLLVNLKLDDCESLTDRTLIEGFKLPELRSLELLNCPKITLKGIESLVKSCPLLEFLSIPSTLIIDDNALFVIGNGFKHLRQLKITDFDDIAEKVRVHINDVFEALRDSMLPTVNWNLNLLRRY